MTAPAFSSPGALRLVRLVAEQAPGLDPEGHGERFKGVDVDAFERFLDALPASAFAENRIVPPSFPASRDVTVAALIRLMRERKSVESAA